MESFQQMLEELSACDQVQGKLAASIVRFAFEVGRHFPVPVVTQAVETEPAPDKLVRRSSYRMSEAHKAKLADARREQARRKAQAADGGSFLVGQHGGSVLPMANGSIESDRDRGVEEDSAEHQSDG